MKTIFKYCSSIFLALVILSVSGGFTLSKMICLESGYTQYAFTKQSDCCDKGNLPPVRFEKPCCDISNQIISVDNYTPSFAKALKADFSLVATLTPSLPVVETLINQISSHYVTTLPPPLSGIDFLLSIHKLTV